MRFFFNSTSYLVLLVLFGGTLAAQTSKAAEPSKTPSPVAAIKSSAAFAEILLRRTENESELESLLLDYTEEYPRVKELKFSLTLIQKDSDRLLAVKPADTGKLTLALGKLMVRRIELETDLWRLRQNYADGHPDVKRAKRKVEIYEKAINEILG